MADAIDPGLLRRSAHSPSYFSLARSMSNSPGQQRDLVDFCIPCNPYFPTPGMFAELQVNLETVLRFYPSDAGTIAGELCATLGLNPQTVAMGNGSTELITWLDHLLVRESLATPVPTFGRWTDQPLETGKRVDMYPLREAEDFELDVDAFVAFVRQRGSRVAVICNPNNPDGGYLPRDEVVRMIDELADLDLVVVDESFIDFVDAEAPASVADEATVRRNVIVLKSLGKSFGLHGVRFGYLVANPALARTVRDALPKWNLNSFAEVVVFMLRRHHDAFRQSLQMLARDRWEMSQALASVPGLSVFSSQANFVLVKLPEGADGVQLRDYLLSEHGVFVRECGNKLGITSQFLRLVVRPQADVQRLVYGLAGYFGPGWYGQRVPAAATAPEPVTQAVAPGAPVAPMASAGAHPPAAVAASRMAPAAAPVAEPVPAPIPAASAHGVGAAPQVGVGIDVGPGGTYRMPANGIPANGMHANGMHANGMHANGLAVHGIQTDAGGEDPAHPDPAVSEARDYHDAAAANGAYAGAGGTAGGSAGTAPAGIQTADVDPARATMTGAAAFGSEPTGAGPGGYDWDAGPEHGPGPFDGTGPARGVTVASGTPGGRARHKRLEPVDPPYPAPAPVRWAAS
jgi:histidinol-phosphate/aromatic aminotransferase/cobyric acid decarboxylase-like protein